MCAAPSVLLQTCLPSTGEVEVEDQEFMGILDYTVSMKLSLYYVRSISREKNECVGGGQESLQDGSGGGGTCCQA